MQIRLDDVPLHLRFRHLGERLRLVTFSLLLCLRRDGRAKCSLGMCKLRFGSELQILRRAHRHHGPHRLPDGCLRCVFCLDRIPRRLLGLCAAGTGQGAGIRPRLQQSRMGELNGRYIVWCHDHPYAHRGRVKQACGEVEGHPNTAMGRRMSRQHAAVERDARPGDALHVGHVGIIIQV